MKIQMQSSFHDLPELVSLRQKKGVTLRTIADRTRINMNYLEAIESGDFQKLPGGIYSRSYIRQYAQAIDFDEFELLECYQRRMGIEPDEIVAPEATPARKVLAHLFRLASPLRRSTLA